MEQTKKKGIVSYFSSLKKDQIRLVKLIACIITAFAPLFPWLKVHINKTSQPELHSYSDNLFGLRGVEALFALLIIVLVLVVVLIDMAEYVDTFDRMKNRWFYDPLIEIIISGALILLAFLATAKASTNEFEYYIAWLGGSVKKTIGCYMVWVGIVGITITSIISLLRKSKSKGV